MTVQDNLAALETGSVIGIMGAGQLGKMTADAAKLLGYKTHIFAPEDNAPAHLSCDAYTVAPYDDIQALEKFASQVDVVTFEFENVPARSVKFLEEKAVVYPGWKVLEISQNRIKEKDFINAQAIATAPYRRLTSAAELEQALLEPCFAKAIVKTTEFGYDGKGQARVDTTSDAQQVWSQLGTNEAVIEGFVDFVCEISVIVASNARGERKAFRPAENIHKEGILDVSFVPAKHMDEQTGQRAREIALKLVESLELVGLLAVEFFVTKNGDLLVNEIAPRPHNSGHWTMDGAITSQFEQFVRAVCNLPLGEVTMKHPTRMLNLIGADVETLEELSAKDGAVVHMYGKEEVRAGRKMGHINYVDNA